MLAYALASKPCSEATDIGSILSWGSVFWWDLVELQSSGFSRMPDGNEGGEVGGIWLGLQSYGRIWGFVCSLSNELNSNKMDYSCYLFNATVY